VLLRLGARADIVTTSAQPATIAVAIPCYNEAGAVEAVVAQWRLALPEAEIVVFDNNSSDGTGAIARRLGVRSGISPPAFSLSSGPQPTLMPRVIVAAEPSFRYEPTLLSSGGSPGSIARILRDAPVVKSRVAPRLSASLPSRFKSDSAKDI
jgi:glycosyltransferase involved in cell wall biosynthesis